MSTSARSKRLLLLVALLVLLLIGAIWQYTQITQTSPPAPIAAAPQAGAQAAESQPVVVTKKLAEPGPAAVPPAGTPPAETPSKDLSTSTTSNGGKSEAQGQPGSESAAAPAAETQPTPAAGSAASPPAAAPPRATEPAPQQPPAVARPMTYKRLPQPAADAGSAPQKAPAAAPPAASRAASQPTRTASKSAAVKPAAGSSEPFSLLLTSHRKKENALAALPAQRRSGLMPYLVQVDLGKKGVWWRTLAGAYGSFEEALKEKSARKLDDAVVVKTPYANLLGEFSSEKEADEAARRLRAAGGFPYLLKGPGGTVRLLDGAFLTRTAAEEHRSALEQQGFPSQVIQR